jgi:hypothetical protein
VIGVTQLKTHKMHCGDDHNWKNNWLVHLWNKN